MDARVGDYLNDKLQSSADFEVLDALIASVRKQQALLQKQLDEAEADSELAETEATGLEASIRQRTQAFQKKQVDIDRRLLIVTQSQASDDAVRSFEESMESLHRLQVAGSYMDTIQTVDALCTDALENLSKSVDASLEAYSRLSYLTTTARSRQVDAEGAAPHLVDYIQTRTASVQSSVADALSKDLESVLEKILWPKPGVAIPEALLPQWRVAANRLLTLQRPELEAQLEQRYEAPAQVLLLLGVMLRPIEARFLYHFSGDRQTNSVEKPEFFLSHALDLISAHATFLEAHVQPVLLEGFRGSPAALELKYVDAIAAFVTALLPMLRKKSLSLIQQVATRPDLLSHFVHELLSFDNALREDWRYTDSPADARSTSLSSYILIQQDWFPQWLEIEKDFALSRYQTIVDGSDAFTLDYESVSSASTKPTKAAIRVNDLLETTTDIYRLTPSFAQKLRFLIDIQLALLDRFHQRLSSSLDAYLSMTSSVVRKVQGASAADLAAVQGTNGLDRLCRVLGSAEYLERSMRDWSDDIFFLDLWAELQARTSTGAQPPLAEAQSPDAIVDVAARTSTAAAESDNGALFDETASAYARLRARAEAALVDAVNRDAREALRAYIRDAPSDASAGDEAAASPAPSASLAALLTLLSQSSSFLRNALGPLPLHRALRAIAASVDAVVFERVVLGGAGAAKLTERAVAQLCADVAAMDQALAAGPTSLRRCAEAAALLGLRGGGAGGRTADAQATAEHVDAALFASNEAARGVLAGLGLRWLSEKEARAVVQRRGGPGRSA